MYFYTFFLLILKIQILSYWTVLFSSEHQFSIVHGPIYRTVIRLKKWIFQHWLDA